MFRLFVFLFSCGVYLSSCKSDYEKLVARELRSGVRQDSIFFGLYLGMPRDSFYAQCLRLNQNGIVTNGPENNSVLYVFPGTLSPIDMNFYPEFDDRGTIKMMGILFSFQCWAPWNKECHSNHLTPEVLKILDQWYGPGFLEVEHPKTGTKVWVKVNGDRQTKVFLKNDKQVRVEIEKVIQ